MTPSVPPEDHEDDDDDDDGDGDVSESAFPDVCVPLRLSRRKAQTAPTRPGGFYHVGRGSLHFYTIDARTHAYTHAHTHTHI